LDTDEHRLGKDNEKKSQTYMNTDFQESKHKDLIDKIIKVFYKVYGQLGYGFLQKGL
jgi:hypothetical protein